MKYLKIMFHYYAIYIMREIYIRDHLIISEKSIKIKTNAKADV